VHERAFSEPIDNRAFEAAAAAAYNRIRSSLPGHAAANQVMPRNTAVMASLLDSLERVIDPTLLFLGVLSEDGRDVTTFMTYQDGERAANFSYKLENSPCATVLGPQALCIYPDDVAAIFPLDVALQRLGARGYVGMPLLSRAGEKLGIVAAVTDHSITNLDEVRGALKLFGRRLSLELERSLSGEDVSAELTEAISLEDARLRDTPLEAG
jgi:hypothetical protein